ncbi:unnamed protein product [Discosporangium mesarthrocarpum]
MCQLMGMQANNPTDFCFSFRGFRERGGRTDKHVDGWGVAFFEGRGCRCFIDLTPSAHSPIASLICTYPIKTQTVIAHVRLATQGRAHLQNVHPFTRELWGRYWVFAHNGDVPHGAWVGRKGSCGAALYTKGERYTPVGDTDSEAAFCYFLNHLLKAYPDGPPSMADVYTTLRELWEGLCEQEGAIFNFLMGHNGDTLFAGCWSGARPGSSVWNSLYYTVREFPFSRCRLVDDDYEVDFTTVTNAKVSRALLTSKAFFSSRFMHM